MHAKAGKDWMDLDQALDICETRSSSPAFQGSGETMFTIKLARLLSTSRTTSSTGLSSPFVSAALYTRSSSCPSILFSKHTLRTKSDMAAPAVSKNLPPNLATVDLSAYDPEQSKLMEERCILVDAEDRAYGASDKKTCTNANVLPLAHRMLTALQAI